MYSKLRRKSNHYGSFILFTEQKLKFSLKKFFSKCDQICSFLRILSHLQKKSLMESSIFCAVFEIRFRVSRFINTLKPWSQIDNNKSLAIQECLYITNPLYIMKKEVRSLCCYFIFIVVFKSEKFKFSFCICF